mgnify:CR=1 FL=1
MKTRKTVAKRFRVTTNGKVIKRYCGQNHFNARSSSNITRKKRRNTSMSKTLVKTIQTLTNTF